MKPYICVACEKVIFAQDFVASLISLFGKVIIQLSAEAPEIPQNAVMPKEWAVFSSWDLEPEDENKEFYFCLEMFHPDGSQFAETYRQRLNVEVGKRCQMSANMSGFPIGQAGTVKIKVWVEQNHQIAVPLTELKIELEVNRSQASPIP
jgi:hypothetical protein